MKAAAAEQMRKIDKEASALYGIPGIVLMENAGYGVYQEVMKMAGEGSKKVCIVCGRGNNGGDGFAAARHLSFTDNHLSIFLIGSGNELKGDALVNYTVCKNMGLDIKYIKSCDDLEKLKDSIRDSGIIVDAVLGTGVHGEVTGLCRNVIDIINEYANHVLSVDIPSGIDADTGRVLGSGVRADRTVTFALPKIGLYTYPGAGYTGEVVLKGISMPPELIEKQDINTEIITGDEIRSLFPKRRKDSNKGTYGRAYIIGGSSGMMGAAVMCTLAALRSGAGLVEVGVPMSIQPQVASLAVEAMASPLPEEDGRISLSSAGEVGSGIKRASSFAIGPGLSQSDGLLKLLEKVALESDIPGVIDADGLNLLSRNMDILYRAKKPLILTPHPGEMSRLINESVGYVQDNRIKCARDFSMKFGVVTVLKGAGTVVASPDGRVYINTTGNPGMAKGGSGDVLTGMIVSFLAQGMEPIDAARSAAFLHGLAGDMALKEKGEYGMKAGDVIDMIPSAIKSL